ncbi:MAG TPA: RND transporter [Pirellulales bacterium]|jgi:hypothetical protein|nr:RND transporter [Pirellulales bacterium]
MYRKSLWGIVAPGLVAATIGCGKTEPVPVKQASAGHSHDAWWCDEHGVPESVCALCSSKVAAEFQKKGDWCRNHDRPDSQCFACHPELEAKFAALYEAKYGKQPPKPDDGHDEHQPKS